MNPIAPLVLSVVLTATAVAGDLGGYLERSAESEFAGEQLVACDTPDGDRSSLFQIAQSEGIVAAWVSDDAEVPIVTVGPGTSSIIEEETVEATLVEGTVMEGEEVYSVGEETETTFLGRPALDVSLLRDGTERVRLTVDAETGAVVRTRAYDGSGDLYCDRRLLSFETGPVTLPDGAEAAGDQESAEPIPAPDLLPAEIAGFQLLDTYELEDGTLSYYSDGFFSAGVVLTDRPVSLGIEDAVAFRRGGAEYLRQYEAGTVTVTWTTAEGNMALVGDLPPDLLAEVVDGLPAPSQRGFFGRIWETLFG